MTSDEEGLAAAPPQSDPLSGQQWHPLSPSVSRPASDDTSDAASYFALNRHDSANEPSQELASDAGILDGSTQTPRPSTFRTKASARPSVDVPQLTTRPLTLKLPAPPHRISARNLRHHLEAVRSPNVSSTVDPPQATCDIACAVLAAVSARSEQQHNLLKKQLAASKAERDALLALLRAHSSVTEQLVERALVRARTELPDEVSEYSPKTWEIELQLPCNRDETIPARLDRRDTASIHSAVEAAMSEAQFDAKSVSSLGELPHGMDSSSASVVSDSEPRQVNGSGTRQRNSSLSARIFGGWAAVGSTRQTAKHVSSPSAIDEQASSLVADQLDRSHSATEVESSAAATHARRATLPGVEDSPLAKKSSTWAGVWGWGERFSKPARPKEDSGISPKSTILTDTDAVKRSPSSQSVASTAASSIAPDNRDKRVSDPSETASAAPSFVSNTANAVTVLISKRQIDNPALSIPSEAPLPSLSNPASVQPSPARPSFGADGTSGNDEAKQHPPHFTALMEAASQWVTDGQVRHRSATHDGASPSSKVSQAVSGLVASVADEQGILENYLDAPVLSRSHSSPGASDTKTGDVSRIALLRRQSEEAKASHNMQQSDYMTATKDAIGKALGINAANPLNAFVRKPKPLSPHRGRIEPTVTLPTLGLTRQASVFQAAMSQPVLATAHSAGSTSAASMSNAIMSNAHPENLSSPVEMAAIGSSEGRPVSFSDQASATGMERLIDRYGFMHEKNGVRTMREMRQKQIADAKDAVQDEGGPNSLKRLLAQLDGSDENKEKAQQQLWDEFIRKRRLKASQTIGDDNSPARKNRVSVLLTGSKVGAAALATGAADAQDDDLLYSENVLGVARMGTSGKAGKDAFKELKRLIKAGIPPAYRPAVWSELSGATDLREPGYYQELLSKNVADADSLCLKQINADVGRTFGNNVFFGGDGPGVEKLRRVLVAYSWHNPEVGYCQGMNLLAGTLLLALPTEEDSFWILCCIVERILPSDYYTPSLLVSRADQRVLRDLVARELPALHSHLQEQGVELEAVTFGWFLSLYSMCLPIHSLLRILDLFFCDGVVVLFRTALAILQINLNDLMATTSSSDLYMLMRSMASSMHQADKLVKAASDDYKHSVKTKDINALREKHVKRIQDEMS